MAIWNCEGKLIANTGICNGHMAYFDSQGARQAWFSGKSIGSFNEYSYTRPDQKSVNAYAPGAIHVNMSYSSSTEIDYIMFKNNDIDSSRWYYGKVVNREYVSVNGTRLWFDIDWFSTFSDKLNYGFCYVERTHIKKSDDVVGGNSTGDFNNPEPITVYVKDFPYSKWNSNYNSRVVPNIKPDTYCIYATTDENGDNVGTLSYKAGTPVMAYTWNGQNPASKIKEYYDAEWWKLNDNSNIQSIIALTYEPSELQSGETTIKHEWSSELPTLDEMNVYNGKSLCYPYCYITARCVGSDPIIIKPQDFGSMNVPLTIEGCGGINGGYRFYIPYTPTSWIGSSGMYLRYLDLPKFQQIPITVDSFRVWQQTQGTANAVSIASGISLGVVGAALSMSGVGALAGAGMLTSGIGMLSSGIAQQVGAMNQPDTVIGGSNGDRTQAFDLHGISFYLHSPSEYDLQSVDDYFTMYGYNVSKIMKPKLNVRQNVTYVKTKNAQVTGSCPQEAINQAQALLNNGTAFWNCSNIEIGTHPGENPDS